MPSPSPKAAGALLKALPEAGVSEGPAAYQSFSSGRVAWTRWPILLINVAQHLRPQRKDCFTVRVIKLTGGRAHTALDVI
jgi:hypothetical protein